MAPPIKPLIKVVPRLDLSPSHLFQLSVYSIYVSSSPSAVASLLNAHLKLKPRLTTSDVKSTYLHLHDTEDEAWVRAKDMNRLERELLRTILRNCGVEEKFWNVDIVKPVKPTAGLRLESPIMPESFEDILSDGDELAQGDH